MACVSSFLAFMLLVTNCCCWGPVVVDIPFIPVACTLVGVLSVGFRAMAGATSVFNIPAVVGVSAVVGVFKILLLLASLLYLEFHRCWHLFCSCSFTVDDVPSDVSDPALAIVSTV